MVAAQAVARAGSETLTAALCPSAAAAALAAIEVIEDEPSRIARLHENAAFFLARLRDVGFDCLSTASAVVPVICGDDWQAYRLARYCQKQGIYVQAIPHPVVPKGTARLRAAVSAEHRLDDLDRCVDVLEAGARIVGGILHERSVALPGG